MTSRSDVLARINSFRKEQITRVANLETDTNHSLKEILIMAGHGDMRRHHVELTLAELLDDLLATGDTAPAESSAPPGESHAE